jgi:type IV secretory pathway VirB4 component
LTQSGNQRIINAQMFLILKFLENQIRINKESQNKQRITIAVDEAHLLIDRQYPVALNFMYQMVKRIRKYNGNIMIITQSLNDFVGDETIKKYSTALINNCQYSLYFKLNPNDLNTLQKLLSFNPLSDKEMQELSMLNRGECLFNLTSTKRFILQIKSSAAEFELFKT